MGEHVTTRKAMLGETPIDPSGLRPSLKGRVYTRNDLIPFEAENIRLAFKKYFASVPSHSKAPFTDKWALRLHREMFGKVWTWAGELRTLELTLGVAPAYVASEFYKLFADIHHWQEPDMPFIVQAATLHHRAVWIHPFENGNGRWARLLANIWLRQHNQPLTRWPETGIAGNESPIRKEYIAALHEADQHNMEPLIALHERYATDASGAD